MRLDRQAGLANARGQQEPHPFPQAQQMAPLCQVSVAPQQALRLESKVHVPHRQLHNVWAPGWLFKDHYGNRQCLYLPLPGGSGVLLEPVHGC